MRILLDTVAFYRAATYPARLSAAARRVLDDPSQELMVSLVSAWELAIKSSLGKLPLPCAVGEFFAQASRDLLAQRLGLKLSHIDELAVLPRHHRDPFDRMIIAQALVESCGVMTSDESFAAYGVRVVW